MSQTIGIDIGGTKIAAGVVTADGQIVELLVAPTPSHDTAATEQAILGLVGRLRAHHDISAVGVGAAAWIGTDRSTVLFSPHLAWRDHPLRDSLESLLQLPVTLENDANAAAWGEYRFGAAQGCDFVACVTLGTGIGGGIVTAGEIFRGAFGLAGEWGHLRVVSDGRRCACGNRGCWEQYASGRALEREARDLVLSSPVAGEALLAAADGDPQRITGPTVSATAAAGDPAAIEIVTEAGRWLGQGIADLCAVLDPSVLVVGGGVAAIGEPILGPARERYRQVLAGRGFRPTVQIRGATNGPNAGLIGAADLARVAAG